MKSILHRVFVEPAAQPFWGWNAHARREQSRERIRRQVEAFINAIGADHVVSIVENAPTLGLFSVCLWWRDESADGDVFVVRAADEGRAI